ncbi:TLD domain containing protein [Nitzschia inconspicua]|uniref:TLD domain containing protein n=1 Tax=Nitzschia inconspicua TaxID=303405 RepID=A0A9K3M5L6_9STRA|nr:TLD domain containing protein [Nitzschia inconspicua]
MRLYAIASLLVFQSSNAFQGFVHQHEIRQRCSNARFGWLENFFEPQKAVSISRQVQYPEQYPASYEVNDIQLPEDERLSEAKLLRPLLKNTQLESRPLRLVYDAEKNGWNPTAFHRAVDGMGAAVVLVETKTGQLCGGYNPKGFASLGGARPSVSAFLFYQKGDGTFQKLQKVGGGGLACARDDPNFGISFGPDALVIGLQPGRERIAQSKLGPYYERGPQDLPSLFGGDTELTQLKVLVGCYEEGEEIPYSGGVLDMTSG